ncbi:hypothetical protein [Flagellimonas marina]|uniref:Uncharacterized protein n=1 Tax=Flagellimonas marina TaxID=1775168 RepID=A0ABV8PL06_9FLAO
MKTTKQKCKIPFGVVVTGILLFFCSLSQAQKPEPPIPVEFLLGHKEMYSQIVIKKKFAPESKFNFFGLATYSATHDNTIEENRAIMISQISYDVGKGFGLMAGADYNSFSGFSPILGPQHNFASKKFLAVTVASFFLNEDSDFKIFGLYEYKPPINDVWSLYTRFQFIYNTSLAEGSHNISYVYLRAGVKRNNLIFGLGANLDWAGPNKDFGDNYGGFVRWEFN